MRTKFVVLFAVVLIATLAIPIAAEAQSIGNGFGIFLSWGDSKADWTSRLVLKDAVTGEDLASENGVIKIPRDHGILGQVVFAKDVANFKPDDFKFCWSTLAAPSKESEWVTSVFDPRFGWVFAIRPDQFAGGLYDTPLQLRVTVKNGRSKHVRVIFKITYGHSDTFGREILFIRPCDPIVKPVVAPVRQEAAIDPNFLELKRAVEALDQNTQVLADGLNANNQRDDEQEARIARLEGAWMSQTTPVQPPVYSPPPPAYSGPAYFAPSCPTRAQLEEKYRGRTCYVFYSSTNAARSWWVRTNRGWIRSSSDLQISSSEEKCWNYDYTDVSRRGWIEFGLGIGNAQPTADAVYPIDGRLHIQEVR